jgi:phosphatidylserine/phosphatidylglycerophosphate/cardiolipin synthase-like enzyme
LWQEVYAVKRNLVVSLLIVVCIIAVAVIYLRVLAPAGLPATVAAADDREFFPAANSLLKSAGKSIDVVLYQGRFYFHYPASTSNALICDLIDAAGRGVKVRVVMELADWNFENTEENRDVAQVLAGSGVEVYYDDPEVTSHTKLLIVDGAYTVVGSNNWNHYALDANNEANVILNSRRVAGVFTRYFEQILDKSTTDYTPAIEPIPAAKFMESRGRYVLIRDLGDSASYSADSQTAHVYIGDLRVTVRDSPLGEILAVDSTFFAKVPGETLRVLGSINPQGDMELDALDIESLDTPRATAVALAKERENLSKARFEEASLEWFKGARVTPVPNRTYAPEIKKLIDGAHARIWIAMLDVRYYASTPRTAANTKAPDEIPSLTNMILGELVEAAVDGIDVRLVCDMGWQGNAPPDRLTFMEKLKAAGGKVYEDSPDITTHAKILIVDDDFAVVGSTNWSYHALEENNETSVIVRSEQLNHHYAEYIQALIDAGQPF